jgi:hypothetical protein
MNNTVITSISALVFLVVGLLIGKSNKQIEIQTIVKTNIIEKPVEKTVEKIVEKIVEKPVVEYIPKYITNFVEKVVESELPEEYKNAFLFKKTILNGTVLEFNETPYTESVSVKVIVDEPLWKIVSEKKVLEEIENSIKNSGIKINENSRTRVIAIFKASDYYLKNQYVYSCSIQADQLSYGFDSESFRGYRYMASIWHRDSFGIVSSKDFNQEFANRKLSRLSEFLSKDILKSNIKTKIDK